MTRIEAGTCHTIPKDWKEVLTSSEKMLNIWNGLTPLGRNEWICWIISVKKQETRIQHIRRASQEILNGKRRPCCWAGCPHRK